MRKPVRREGVQCRGRKGQNETVWRPEGFTWPSDLSGFSLSLSENDLFEYGKEEFR